MLAVGKWVSHSGSGGEAGPAVKGELDRVVAYLVELKAELFDHLNPLAGGRPASSKPAVNPEVSPTLPLSDPGVNRLLENEVIATRGVVISSFGFY